MRKITAGLFISLDGVVEAPDRWHFPYFNEMGAAVNATLGAADTMLLGKKLGDARKIVVLLATGLLDELHLLMHPITVPKGARLFDEAEPTIPLTLITSQTFTTGVLNLVYGPAESAGAACQDVDVDRGLDQG